MGKGEVKQKQAMQVDRWEKFLEAQGGCYPASMAAIKLRMTPQGVYQASERGWITFFQIGRNRWYGMKDVKAYRWNKSARFFDNRILPSPEPRNFSEPLQD